MRRRVSYPCLSTGVGVLNACAAETAAGEIATAIYLGILCYVFGDAKNVPASMRCCFVRDYTTNAPTDGEFVDYYQLPQLVKNVGVFIDGYVGTADLL